MKTESNKKIYEESLKPLLKNKYYGHASELIHRNPELKRYMSNKERRTMMDYYEKILYTLTSGLDDLITKLETEKLK